MSGKDALTDDKYWDSHWKTRRDGARKPLLYLHPFYGKYGVFLRMVHRHVGSIENKRVLELGGGGKNYRLFALHKYGGATVTAIDFSGKALEQLKDTFALNNGKVSVIEADITTYEDKEQKYDLITHHGVIEHFSDFSGIFKTCRKLLAPGGQMLFSVPNMHCFGARAWRKWSPYNWSKHIYHPDSLVESVCDETGFVIKERYFCGVPMLGLAIYEKKNLVSRFCSLVQKANVVLSGIVFPFWDRVGHPSFSTERYFLVTLRK